MVEVMNFGINNSNMFMKQLCRFINTMKENEVSTRTDQTSISECDECEFSVVKRSFTTGSIAARKWKGGRIHE